MRFDEFGLCEPIVNAVAAAGYAVATPIQEKAIPHVLAGRDLLGCAQTGTGKTAAFALPILHHLVTTQRREDADARAPRVLVLSPTRELAAQIGESFATYGNETAMRQAIIFGGVRQAPQTKALTKGVDIVVATPGRLMDLLGQKLLTLKYIEVLVLDEADRMLDMGFIDDVRRIVQLLPRDRQTLMFSATMPPKIQSLAESILRNPVAVHVTPETPAADTVTQAVYFVERHHKRSLLQHLLDGDEISRALVFTRTKRGADSVHRFLDENKVQVEVIHSDKPQAQRARALEQFKKGHIRVLVASDIAARGLDVDDISHVINFDMPNEPETYVHRIGRTGRAGSAGVAISFCDMEERLYLDGIEKLLGRPVMLVADHPFPSPLPRAIAQAKAEVKLVAGGWRKPIRRNLLRRR